MSKVINYRAAYWFAENGWVTAQCLDFPGAVSQGKGLEHARENLRDAMLELILYRFDSGEALPKPDPAATTMSEDEDDDLGTADVEEAIHLIIDIASNFRAVRLTSMPPEVLVE